MMRDIVDPKCNIIFGASVSDNMEDEVEITIIATGFNHDKDKADEQPQDAEDEEEQEQQPTKQEYADFLANRIKSGKVSPSAYDDDEQDLASNGREIRGNVQRDEPMSSRVSIDEDDIPPFLRKLRNKK